MRLKIPKEYKTLAVITIKMIEDINKKQKSGEWSYTIYTTLLERWIAERSAES